MSVVGKPTANLALFDFDGTITTREMLPDFFRLAIPTWRVRVGGVLLAPLIVGYKLGLVSGVRVRAAIVRFGFAGVSLSDYQRHGRAFADHQLPKVIRPDMLKRIEWHKAQGDTVVVVSGALDVYLRHWCATHQLPLICSALEERDGALTGRYQGEQCVRSNKAQRVAERYTLSEYADIYAYGDTPEDFELLAIASRKFYQGRELP